MANATRLEKESSSRAPLSLAPALRAHPRHVAGEVVAALPADTLLRRIREREAPKENHDEEQRGCGCKWHRCFSFTVAMVATGTAVEFLELLSSQRKVGVPCSGARLMGLPGNRLQAALCRFYSCRNLVTWTVSAASSAARVASANNVKRRRKRYGNRHPTHACILYGVQRQGGTLPRGHAPQNRTGVFSTTEAFETAHIPYERSRPVEEVASNRPRVAPRLAVRV